MLSCDYIRRSLFLGFKRPFHVPKSDPAELDCYWVLALASMTAVQVADRDFTPHLHERLTYFQTSDVQTW
jgi:hypothetical protein